MNTLALKLLFHTTFGIYSPFPQKFPNYGLLYHQIRIVTPNKLKNKTNDNLKLLGNNRNPLQGFVKQKIVAVHCCGFLG